MMHRAIVVLGALVAVALASPSSLLPPPRQASVTIESLYSACPSTTPGRRPPRFHHLASRSPATRSNRPCACNDAKDVTAHLPAGLIGNPHATPQCDIAQFASDQCPVDSQLGVAEVERRHRPRRRGGSSSQFPLPRLQPRPAARPAGPPRLQERRLRHADLRGRQRPHRQRLRPRRQGRLDRALRSARRLRQLTWGVPAAPVHDYLSFGLRTGPFLIASSRQLTTRLLRCRTATSAPPTPPPSFELCHWAAPNARPAVGR